MVNSHIVLAWVSVAPLDAIDFLELRSVPVHGLVFLMDARVDLGNLPEGSDARGETAFLAWIKLIVV
jgi:hypothetical protein